MEAIVAHDGERAQESAAAIFQMLEALGMRCGELKGAEAGVLDLPGLEAESNASPRICVVCLDPNVTRFSDLRASRGFAEAATAAGAGLSVLTVRQWPAPDSRFVNRAAEIVGEVAVHLYQFPVPSGVILHLDLDPGRGRRLLRIVDASASCSTEAVGKSGHASFALLNAPGATAAAATQWGSFLLNQLQPSTSIAASCACCA